MAHCYNLRRNNNNQYYDVDTLNIIDPDTIVSFVRGANRYCYNALTLLPLLNAQGSMLTIPGTQMFITDEEYQLVQDVVERINYTAYGDALPSHSPVLRREPARSSVLRDRVGNVIPFATFHYPTIESDLNPMVLRRSHAIGNFSASGFEIFESMLTRQVAPGRWRCISYSFYSPLNPSPLILQYCSAYLRSNILRSGGTVEDGRIEQVRIGGVDIVFDNYGYPREPLELSVLESAVARLGALRFIDKVSGYEYSYRFDGSDFLISNYTLGNGVELRIEGEELPFAIISQEDTDGMTTDTDTEDLYERARNERL